MLQLNKLQKVSSFCLCFGRTGHCTDSCYRHQNVSLSYEITTNQTQQYDLYVLDAYVECILMMSYIVNVFVTTKVNHKLSNRVHTHNNQRGVYKELVRIKKEMTLQLFHYLALQYIMPHGGKFQKRLKKSRSTYKIKVWQMLMLSDISRAFVKKTKNWYIVYVYNFELNHSSYIIHISVWLLWLVLHKSLLFLPSQPKLLCDWYFIMCVLIYL